MTRTTAAWWRGLDREALAGDFDEGSLKRGVTYARGRRVLSLSFDKNTDMLTAHVVGSGRIYETSVGRDGHGYDSFCTCPVTYDCKHVVAVLLVAGAGQLEYGSAVAARNVRAAEPGSPSSDAGHGPFLCSRPRHPDRHARGRARVGAAPARTHRRPPAAAA